MPAQKRKSVLKASDCLFGRGKTVKTCEEVEEAVQPTGEEEVEEKEEQEEMSPEEKLAKAEEELVRARRKELKAMYASDLSELASKSGLEVKKKEEMVEAIVVHEANERASVRDQAARVRQVVVQRKEEFESLALPELRQRCSEAGIKGNLAKHERVEQLLKLWQEDDGVDKALAKSARDAREGELLGMDKATLCQLCERGDVDPYVREVMVDRLVGGERSRGLFRRPEVPKEDEDGEGAEKEQGKDLVESLLASEASRKRGRELKRQQEDAAAARLKEVKAKTNEELKEMITSRGGEASGKKEELVELVLSLLSQEDRIAARKAKLKALSTEDLKGLSTRHGLAASKKDDIVESLLALEAKQRERLQAYEAKAAEVLAEKRGELEAFTAGQLKDMCAEGGLKIGTSKDERVERLLESAASSGEVDKMVSAASAKARRVELLTYDAIALTTLCRESLVDPLVKEVMVERILAREEELGHKIEPEEERKAKKAKTTK